MTNKLKKSGLFFLLKRRQLTAVTLNILYCPFKVLVLHSMSKESGREYYQLRYELSKQLNAGYNNKLNALNNDSTPFICEGWTIMLLKGKGHKLRGFAYMDFKLLCLISFMQLRDFKDDKNIRISGFPGVNITNSLNYLVKQGYFTKVPGNGTYTVTELFDKFVDDLPGCHRRALKKFAILGSLKRGNKE